MQNTSWTQSVKYLLTKFVFLGSLWITTPTYSACDKHKNFPIGHFGVVSVSRLYHGWDWGTMDIIPNCSHSLPVFVHRFTWYIYISWTSIAMSVCTAKTYLLPSLQLYVGMVPTCCKLWPFVLTLSNGKEPKRATSWMLIDQVSCIQRITKNIKKQCNILGWYESLVHLETRSKEVCAWKLEWSFERYSLSHNH